MKIEYKIKRLRYDQLQVPSVGILIDFSSRIIFFAYGPREENIHYRTAKTYRRRLKMEEFEIQ
jgi:hypothetical protein